jgi:hypothetical protein
MADATSSGSPAIHKPASVSLARARLVWALRPLGFLVLALWVLHPDTADRLEHTHTALLGFLFGALYGLVIYGPTLRQYIMLHQPGGRLQANRVPDEYYWGQVDAVLFDNTGGRK